MGRPTRSDALKRHRWGWVALALLLLLSPAIGADPPISVDPSLVEPALLRYSYERGAIDTYHFDVAASTELLSLSPPERREAALSAAYDLQVAVQNTDEEGNGFVYHEVSDLSLSLTEGGAPVDVRTVVRSVEGIVRRLKMSTRGQVIDSEATDPIGVSETRPLLAVLLDSWDWLGLELPEAALPVGGTWEQDQSMVVDAAGTDIGATATATNTFLGYATINGRRHAVVQSDVNAWLDVPEGGQLAGLSGPSLGRGVGVGYYYIDGEGGRLNRASIEYGMVMRSLQSDSPTDLTITMTIEIQAR